MKNKNKLLGPPYRMHRVYRIGKLSSYFLARSMGHPPLQVVQIYFNTATYDEIDKDVKVEIVYLALNFS